MREILFRALAGPIKKNREARPPNRASNGSLFRSRSIQPQRLAAQGVDSLGDAGRQKTRGKH
jgi:hypothetical protein